MPPSAPSTSIQQFEASGVQYRPGDVCLMVPHEAGAQPYVGEIMKIQSDEELLVKWYYRPEEAVSGRKPFHGAQELFDSDHTDVCPTASVLTKCAVHSLRAYEALPHISEHDYFVRFRYHAASQRFEPSRVPVYCKCEQPYNPDRPMIRCIECDSWYHHDCLGMSMSDLAELLATDFVCTSCDAQAKAQLNGRAQI
uniref:PHD-type domain-containing protein n=1 Tax=Chlamydomonas euryale TaxID=1486919 RepID=A0A7R9V747_9CHLO|mmetsp:Transcript_22777/g.67810  ORF Transcript_22777/g.67810 Transcript_22777/m.67810 type:complete len:196 (+) Transcript_22777:387-974(+)